MFVAAAVAILVALALAIVRAIKGPTVFDRVLAGNSVGTLAILLLAVIGFLTGRPEFLDIGLTYGLLNLIGTLAVLKFFRHGDLAYDVDGGAQVMTLVIDIASWALILLGSFFTIVGAIGLVRMPDVYTRMHAASVTDTLGVGLSDPRHDAAGRLQPGDAEAAVSAGLFFFTGPVVTHALAQACLHEKRRAEAGGGPARPRPRRPQMAGGSHRSARQHGAADAACGRRRSPSSASAACSASSSSPASTAS